MGDGWPGWEYATWAFGHEYVADVCLRPHPEKGDSVHGDCVGSAVAVAQIVLDTIGEV